MTIPEQLLTRFPATPLGAHVVAATSRLAAPQSIEDRLLRVELDLEARAFVSRYAYYFDGKDLAGLMTLYAHECVLVNTAGTYVGAEAIRLMQASDMPKTAISFHTFSNPLVVIENLVRREVYVTTYMYNLAVRDDEHYGTVGTALFALKGEADGSLKATTVRISIDSRHSLAPKFVPVGDPGPHAASKRNSYDLVGRLARHPTSAA